MTILEGARRSTSPYRHLWIVLALLIPAVLLGFAPSYFKGVTFSGRTTTPLIHVHAGLMALWVLMLIAQAWFVRTARFTFHRWVGRSSLIIAPLSIAMTIVMIHERLNANAEVVAPTARFQIYNLMEVTGFVQWFCGAAVGSTFDRAARLT